MKFVVNVVIGLFCFATLACPNLDGVYLCPKESNDWYKGLIQIKTLDRQYELTDLVSGKSMITKSADGVKHIVLDMEFTSECSPTVAKDTVVTTEWSGNKVTQTTERFLNSENKLVVIDNILNVDFGLGEGPTNYRFERVCNRVTIHP